MKQTLERLAMWMWGKRQWLILLIGILIAIVLGPILEKYMLIAGQAYGWSMVLRPQFAAICLVLVLAMLMSLRLQAKGKSTPVVDATTKLP